MRLRGRRCPLARARGCHVASAVTDAALLCLPGQGLPPDPQGLTLRASRCVAVARGRSVMGRVLSWAFLSCPSSSGVRTGGLLAFQLGFSYTYKLP